MTYGELKELQAIVHDLLIDYKAGNVEYDYAEARILELIAEREPTPQPQEISDYDRLHAGFGYPLK